MVQADLEMGGEQTRNPPRDRRDSRIRNYIGDKGVLKSKPFLLSICNQ
jgi:hypothetical protein